jgi:hypothetical protein
METGIPTNVQQIERKLLAAFERHGGDGRAITIESLAASADTPGRTRELALALKNLVDRGLVRRAGEDPIPGSAIAFRLVRPLPREPVDKAENQPARSQPHSSATEQMGRREAAKSTPTHRANAPAA